MGRPAGWIQKLTGREAMRSPGAPSLRREVERQFWVQIATGITSERAAETVSGLYRAEVTHQRGPWKSADAVEWATLEWMSWFNNQRLMESLGYIPHAEAGANCYRQLRQPTSVAD